jgi:hypothetical protein
LYRKKAIGLALKISSTGGAITITASFGRSRMDEDLDIVLNVFLIIVCTLLLVAALAYLYRLAKRRAERMQAVIATVEQRFGFKNNSPGGVMPNLFAEIGGLKTAVDVCFQNYSRGGETANGRRPYTRVRVQLRSDPGVSVHVRAQRHESPAEWPERKTGDTAFDERFASFAANEVDIAALGPTARAAFLNAEQSVTLTNKLVLWVERNHTLDADRLVQAVQSCIDVAAAIDQQQTLAADTKVDQFHACRGGPTPES